MCWLQYLIPGAGTAADIPIQSLLAALILAAINGQASLRGMWLWARAHSDWLTRHLPFHRNRIPALETFRTLLCRLD